MQWSDWGQVKQSTTVVRLLVLVSVITWLSSMNVYQAAETQPGKSFLAGSDWPMYRHDPELTAATPLRGGLGQTPRVAWSVDLGGPHVPRSRSIVRDVTGDGQDEFLTLSATASCAAAVAAKCSGSSTTFFTRASLTFGTSLAMGHAEFC